MESREDNVGVSARRVIVVIDLAGYTKAFQQRSDEGVAAFLDRYYALCEGELSAAGGRVVKFMGDACLAVFAVELAAVAVSTVSALALGVEALAREFALPLVLGANVHLASVVEAELGSGQSRRLDLIGRGVNQAFLLGRGPGVRISEAVYRSLPSGARAAWLKHKPPAVYSLQVSGEPYAGGGKDAASNALRW